MESEILINVTAREVRAAVIENGVLIDLFIERASRRGRTGNIYKGKVSRVLPGMQAAFVDIGLERTAFLHTSNMQQTAIPSTGAAEINIRELLREGDEVPVQVLKDPLGTKGARLTTNISVPSRYLVLFPDGGKVGVSSRIEDEGERERLKRVMAEVVPPDSPHGFIVRTAAERAERDALRADMLFLEKLWDSIAKKIVSSRPGELIYADFTLATRIVRDLVNGDVKRVLVDTESVYTDLHQFARTFMPEHALTVELYTGRRPILDLYGVEDEIEKALKRPVALKSGGYVIFDQTEAMTTVDVNTGAYVGHRTQEDTIYRTNLEAAVTIARQLRLRNLGGIIIIDFIDMEEESHRRQVLDALEAALAQDPAYTQVTQHSPLGLVEMTRKRTRESLEHIMCESCPTCDGNGYVKTPESVCYEIFREIIRQHRQFKFNELIVLAHQDVIELMLDEEATGLAELEQFTGKPIRLQTEAMYLQSQFDVVLM
jgi:ribonuclease G